MNKNVSISIDKEIDDLINLFFFHPHRSRDDYIKRYKIHQKERYNREGGYRYSNLFFCVQNIKHCLGVGKEFSTIRKRISPAHFTSIILCNIAVQIVGRQAYIGNIHGFMKEYMNIKTKEHQTALREARNAIEHSGYSLYIYKKPKVNELKVKLYFGLGMFDGVIARDKTWKRSYPSKLYLINPKELYSCFKSACQELKKDLLNHSNLKQRKYFKDHVDIDRWIFIREKTA